MTEASSTFDFHKYDPTYPAATQFRVIKPKAVEIMRVDQPPGDYRLRSGHDFYLQMFLSELPLAVADHGHPFESGARPRSLAIAPPETGLRYTADYALQSLSIALPSKLVWDASKAHELSLPNGDLGGLHHMSFEDNLVASIIEALWENSGDRCDHARMFIDSALETLTLRLLCLATARNQDVDVHFGALATGRHRGGLSGWQLKRVTDYMMAHLGEEVALAGLASIADLSPYHFCRAFKQSTGVPPHAWLTARRIERAQQLMLAHPALGLADIALSVGYSSQAAFGTAFRRAVGFTPAQWRRERAR